MFDHFGMGVRDPETSRAFYEAALAPFGLRLVQSWDAEKTGDYPAFGFGTDTADFWVYGAQSIGGPVHFAFKASSRHAVDAFHKAALAGGGRDNGAPGLRPDYGASYYAAFVLDPDGNNVEAVCHGPA